MSKSAKELLEEAKALASQFQPSGRESMDELRRQAKDLFDRLPEPPCYRRKGDPVPGIAEKQIGDAVRILSMLYALSPNAIGRAQPLASLLASSGATTEEKKGDLFRDIQLLTLATEAHVRALAAMANGQIVEGDLLADDASAAARAALREGMRFRFVGGTDLRPVYDKDTDVSRFDPDDGKRLLFQVSCPSCSKLGQFDVSALLSSHLVTCAGCKSRFCVAIGYADAFQAFNHGVKITYQATLRMLGEGKRRIQFDDRNVSQPIATAPQDLLAFGYSVTKALAFVDDLTTGSHHVVMH